jgi:hypothetical protein
LNDGVNLERLEVLLPKALGVTWVNAIGSPSVVCFQTCTYVRQLESLVTRWQSGDHSILQPVAAYPFMVLSMMQIELRKEAGRKELELLGQSSGARVAAGGNNMFQPLQTPKEPGEGVAASRARPSRHGASKRVGVDVGGVTESPAVTARLGDMRRDFEAEEET